MKKNLLFILVLWQLNNAIGQTNVYHPFPSDSAVWVNESVYAWVGTFYSKLEMSGDTTIGVFSYKKICDFSNPRYYRGAIRQNIPAKKVYFIDTSGVEKVLHDFNLSIGDTVDGVNCPFYVTAIDSTLIGNNYHKTFVFASNIPLIGPSKLIEGVGYSGGFGSPTVALYDSHHKLVCFSERNSVSLYPNPSDPSYPSCSLSLSVGIVNLSKKKIGISIVPNPVQDEISISIGCKDSYTIEIINNLGQLVYSKVNLVFSDSKIDLSNYQSGIYFVRINDSKGNSVVKKVVKD